jgi:hypothetical protein
VVPLENDSGCHSGQAEGVGIKKGRRGKEEEGRGKLGEGKFFFTATVIQVKRGATVEKHLSNRQGEAKEITMLGAIMPTGTTAGLQYRKH